MISFFLIYDFFFLIFKCVCHFSDKFLNNSSERSLRSRRISDSCRRSLAYCNTQRSLFGLASSTIPKDKNREMFSMNGVNKTSFDSFIKVWSTSSGRQRPHGPLVACNSSLVACNSSLVACSSSLVARSSSLVTYPTLWREQSRGVDALTDHLVDAQDGLYLVVW